MAKEKAKLDDSSFDRKANLSSPDTFPSDKNIGRRSSAPSLPAGGVKPSQFFVNKKKKPDNRLAHLKDKNEILDSIKEKMHMMSKTTKVKQLQASKNSMNILNYQTENIFDDNQSPIGVGEVSFDTGILNLEINDLEEKAKEIKDQISEMRDRETIRMKRLFRKDPNNYMHRYRVSQEIINNALNLTLM